MELHSIVTQLEDTQDETLRGLFFDKISLVLKELKDATQLQTQNRIIVPFDDVLKEKLFHSLKEAINTKRPQKCAPIIEEIGKYELNSEDKKLFESVKKAVESYDFKSAIKLLN